MKVKHMLLPVLFALSAQALAEPAPPVKVETSNNIHPAGTRYVTVVVTSLDDSIKVEKIDVNRGNCRIDNQKYLSSKNKETILPVTGLAPMFPYTFYHLTHYWFVAADIPVVNDIPVHYADAIRCNVRRPPQGSLPLLTRQVLA